MCDGSRAVPLEPNPDETAPPRRIMRVHFSGPKAWPTWYFFSAACSSF